MYPDIRIVVVLLLPVWVIAQAADSTWRASLSPTSQCKHSREAVCDGISAPCAQFWPVYPVNHLANSGLLDPGVFDHHFALRSRYCAIKVLPRDWPR